MMVNDWFEFSLGEVAEIVGGGTPSTQNSLYWNGNIPWLTPRDLSLNKSKYISKGERNISDLGLSNSSAKVLPKGSVLLSSRAPIGYVAIADNELSTNQGFRSLIPNEKTCTEFLYYLLINNIEHIKSQASGTTFQEISGSVLKSIAFSFPTPLEQKAIAGVLSALDDKIDLLHRQNQTLEALAQTLFRQWFIEGAGDDWEETSLDQIADYLNGIACQKFPPKDEIHKLPVLKIKELGNGVSDTSDWASTEVSEEYIVHNGDVIFSWSGSLMIKIWDGEDCILNQHLFKVSSTIYPKWFFYFWTKYHLAKFISIAEGKSTTMGHIKRSDLSSSEVYLLPDNFLNKKDQIINPLVEKIILNNQQIATLQKTRKTLLPKLMSGEMRVCYDRDH